MDSASPTLYRPLRTVLLTLHVLSAVAWAALAASIGFLVALSVSSEPGDQKIYAVEMADLLDITLLVYAANTAAFTGFFLAALTTWGYFHWKWVSTKFVITIIQLFVGIFVLSNAVPVVVEAAHEGRDGPGAVVAATAFTMATAFAFQIWLSIAKPGGRTAVARKSRVRLTPAPSWLLVLAIAAPFGDVLINEFVFGKHPPTPAASIVALMVILVARSRRHRAHRASDTEADQPFRVEAISTPAMDVRELRLTPTRGSVRAWEPGSHIDIVLPSGLIRQYSLAGDPDDDGSYLVAVLLELDGRGGSREIHELSVGDRVEVRGPRNNFSLVDADFYLFIAGGIGITPFLPMITELDRRGVPWQLIYRGATRAAMAYTDELESRYGDRVRVLPSDEAPRPDIAELLASQPAGTAAYCCGPETMLDAFEAADAAAPEVGRRVERFDAPDLTDLPSESFEVVLAYSRKRVDVPAETTMLDAMRDALPDLPGLLRNRRLRNLHGTRARRQARPPRRHSARSGSRSHRPHLPLRVARARRETRPGCMTAHAPPRQQPNAVLTATTTQPSLTPTGSNRDVDGTVSCRALRRHSS